MNAVALGEQQFGQISTILSGNTANQRCLGQIRSPRHEYTQPITPMQAKISTLKEGATADRRYILTRAERLCERFNPCVFFKLWTSAGVKTYGAAGGFSCGAAGVRLGSRRQP